MQNKCIIIFHISFSILIFQMQQLVCTQKLIQLFIHILRSKGSVTYMSIKTLVKQNIDIIGIMLPFCWKQSLQRFLLGFYAEAKSEIISSVKPLCQNNQDIVQTFSFLFFCSFSNCGMLSAHCVFHFYGALSPLHKDKADKAKASSDLNSHIQLTV